MTKQPSLTSLIDLGLIYGPLGNDPAVFEDTTRKQPASASLPSACQANEEPLMAKKFISQAHEDEHAYSIQAATEPQVTHVATSPTTTETTRTIGDKRGDDEMLLTCRRESSLGGEKNVDGSTAALTLKAPKLLRNEASISSLSSFFMNNQLKTLNFYYYPSLITKSKWSQHPSLSETPQVKSIEIDDDDDDENNDKFDEQKVA